MFKIFLKYLSLLSVSGIVFLYQACSPSHVTTSESALATSSEALFKCRPNQSEPITNMHRLSKFEYANTLQDLLAPLTAAEKTSTINKIRVELANLPDDTTGQYEKMDTRVSDIHISSQYKIAYSFANSVNSATNRSVFFGSCMSATTPTQACVRTFISDFGLKAYRRPLDQAEIDSLFIFYSNRGTTKTVDLVARLLMSPYFLYHVENRGQAISADTYKLTNYEMASRLSYLYLATMPNQLLLDAAAAGKLSAISDIKVVINNLFQQNQTQVKAVLDKYISEWLDFKNKPDFSSNPAIRSLATLRPGVGIPDAQLKAEMLQELIDLVSHYTWTKPDGQFSEVLTSNISFAKTDRLAALYNIPKWSPGLPNIFFAGSERSGLYTRAGTLYSGTEKTSPIIYGVNTIRNTLCDSIPDPLQSIIDDPTRLTNINQVAQTEREIVHTMTSQSACISCHSYINPYGFAIEAYDSLGGFRANKLEYKFDNSGTIINSLPINSQTDARIFSTQTVSVSGAVELNEKMSASGKVHACFARNFFRFTNRRQENPATDDCQIERNYQELIKAGGGLKNMFQSGGSDPSFLIRRIN